MKYKVHRGSTSVLFWEVKIYYLWHLYGFWQWNMVKYNLYYLNVDTLWNTRQFGLIGLYKSNHLLHLIS